MTASPPPADTALLSFFLGPVQSFIEAAKTTRDLWAGSYTLSWLTVAAMRPLLVRNDVTVITPSVDGNPLVHAYFEANPSHRLDPRHSTRSKSPDRLLPCLPNRFLARVPAAAAEGLATEVRTAAVQEWARIAAAVHERLRPALDALHPGWDANWSAQINSFFEVRAVILPTGDRGKLNALALPRADADATGWAAELDVVSGVLDAARSIRHVPAYKPGARDVPQKCTLLGTYEQLGPAKLTDSKDFWKAARQRTKTSGAAVRPRERLCAVSLVKRYAWPVYLCGKLKPQDRRFDEYLDELKFSDTATTAARNWLSSGAPLDRSGGPWSGQWLHWRSRDQDPDEDPCPPRSWDQIQQKKAKDGPPPAYYGVLVLDGDSLGKLLRGARNPDEPDAWGIGHERPTNISSRLTEFALTQVEAVVEQFAGELVYSGGDDTLALVPLAHAVAAATELAARYGTAMNGCTVSAGLAVVHYKEDLRFALQQARAAEKAAKNAGRDRLALTVCRRSGEHTTAILTWPQAGTFNQLVGLFIAPGVSDRWAYRLREVLPTLEGLPVAAVRAEVYRLLNRTDRVGTEDQMARFREGVLDLFDQKCGAEPGDLDRPIDRAELTDFVTLCQSASFLARGRDR